MQEGEENRRYRRGCPRALKTNSPTDLGTAHCRNHAHGMWVDYHTVQAALRQRTVLIVCNTRGNHADSRHIHRLWSTSGEYCVVGGVRVTTPARTAAVCANSMPFMPAMEVMCCALRNGTSSTEIIACATREGLMNANAQNVFRFATPFAENGGEARALAAMILCGFAPPPSRWNSRIRRRAKTVPRRFSVAHARWSDCCGRARRAREIQGSADDERPHAGWRDRR